MTTRTNLVLDLTIFSAFLVVANPRFTGTTVHEWLSISFAAAVITHLLFHWDWIIQVGSQFIKKLFHQSRLNFVVDTLFLVAMTTTILSGLMISRDLLATFGIQLGQVSASWSMLHRTFADASVVLLGLHTGLHWNWVAANLKRYIFNPVTGLFHRPAPQTER